MIFKFIPMPVWKTTSVEKLLNEYSSQGLALNMVLFGCFCFFKESKNKYKFYIMHDHDREQYRHSDLLRYYLKEDCRAKKIKVMDLSSLEIFQVPWELQTDMSDWISLRNTDDIKLCSVKFGYLFGFFIVNIILFFLFKKPANSLEYQLVKLYLLLIFLLVLFSSIRWGLIKKVNKNSIITNLSESDNLLINNKILFCKWLEYRYPPMEEIRVSIPFLSWITPNYHFFPDTDYFMIRWLFFEIPIKYQYIRFVRIVTLGIEIHVGPFYLLIWQGRNNVKYVPYYFFKNSVYVDLVSFYPIWIKY